MARNKSFVKASLLLCLLSTSCFAYDDQACRAFLSVRRPVLPLKITDRAFYTGFDCQKPTRTSPGAYVARVKMLIDWDNPKWTKKQMEETRDALFKKQKAEMCPYLRQNAFWFADDLLEVLTDAQGKERMRIRIKKSDCDAL